MTAPVQLQKVRTEESLSIRGEVRHYERLSNSLGANLSV